jgi:hypothetical protein
MKSCPDVNQGLPAFGPKTVDEHLGLCQDLSSPSIHVNLTLGLLMAKKRRKIYPIVGQAAVPAPMPKPFDGPKFMKH